MGFGAGIETVKQVYGEIGSKGGMRGRSASSPYLFSGLLRCSECGANITIISGRWHGRGDVVYGCPQHESRRDSVRVKLRDIRSFVVHHMRDIRAIISSDTAQTRAVFAKHIGEITLTPNDEHYLASGKWDFAGRGSIDGAGGPDRTVRATEFSLPLAA